MKTSEYNIFTNYESNRNLSVRNLKGLTESISELGYLESKPISVTEDLKIIDGHHRFEVCKRLGLPIVYQIDKIWDIDNAVVKLNSNQKKWGGEDYIKVWADKGIECYQEVLKFAGETGFSISTSFYICFQSSGKPEFKSGKIYKLNSNRYLLYDLISRASKFLSYTKKRDFILAMVRAIKLIDRDDIEKLMNFLPSLPEQASQANYLTAFENALNKRRKKNRYELKRGL
jgi:hypothetical protein